MMHDLSKGGSAESANMPGQCAVQYLLSAFTSRAACGFKLELFRTVLVLQ
jgi:hypothetical protein